MKNIPSNLKNLKSKVNKLHVDDELVTAPVELRKLSDVLKNYVAKNIYKRQR